MKLLSATIPADCEIALIGDSHEGNADMSRHSLARAIDWLRERPKNRRFANMGDEVDAVVSDDKRYQFRKKDCPIPIRQAERVVKTFKDVAPQCVAWLYGNHPFALQRVGNLTRDLVCKPLGIADRYGDVMCKLAMRTPDRRLVGKLFLAHPFSLTLKSPAKDYEQQQANMKASLKQRLAPMAGDCIVMAAAHTHKLLVVQPAERLVMRDNGRKLRQEYLRAGRGDERYIEPDRRWYCATGSFLRTFSAPDSDGPSYSERALYSPVELGYCVVDVRGGRVVDVRKVVVD